MKKILSLIAIFMLAFIMSGCDSEYDDPPKDIVCDTGYILDDGDCVEDTIIDVFCTEEQDSVNGECVNKIPVIEDCDNPRETLVNDICKVVIDEVLLSKILEVKETLLTDINLSITPKVQMGDSSIFGKIYSAPLPYLSETSIFKNDLAWHKLQQEYYTMLAEIVQNGYVQGEFERVKDFIDDPGKYSLNLQGIYSQEFILNVTLVEGNELYSRVIAYTDATLTNIYRVETTRSTISETDNIYIYKVDQQYSNSNELEIISVHEYDDTKGRIVAFYSNEESSALYYMGMRVRNNLSIRVNKSFFDGIQYPRTIYYLDYTNILLPSETAPIDLQIQFLYHPDEFVLSYDYCETLIASDILNDPEAVGTYINRCQINYVFLWNYDEFDYITSDLFNIVQDNVLRFNLKVVKPIVAEKYPELQTELDRYIEILEQSVRTKPDIIELNAIMNRLHKIYLTYPDDEIYVKRIGERLVINMDFINNVDGIRYDEFNTDRMLIPNSDGNGHITNQTYYTIFLLASTDINNIQDMFYLTSGIDYYSHTLDTITEELDDIYYDPSIIK